jgi:subtilisin family serine protease
MAFVAVGSRIFSTTLNGGYGVGSGTSYAVPFVSSLAALLLSVNDDYTPDQLVTVMRETSTDLGDSGWDKYYGYGCINFSAALEYAQEETSANGTNSYTVVNAQ